MAYYKLVTVSDGGMPDTFQGQASAALSGGNWVVAGSNTLAATLGSDTYTFNPNMVDLVEGGSGRTLPVGLAMKNTASGAVGTFLRRGTVILPANAAVTAGGLVAASSVTGSGGQVSDRAAGGSAIDVVGQAYTGNASGTSNFVVVRLNL